VPGIIGNKFPKTIFVGEAPGATEDAWGEPFVGRSGKLLTKCIEEVFNMSRGEYSILNTVKCRPPDNRDPSKKEKDICSDYLYAQIAALVPCMIVPLGKHAGNIFSPTEMSAGELVKSYFIDEEYGIRIVPCYHPAYILRNKTLEIAFKTEFKRIQEGTYVYDRNLYRCNILSTK